MPDSYLSTTIINLSYIFFCASHVSTVAFPINKRLFRNKIAEAFRMAFRFRSAVALSAGVF